MIGTDVMQGAELLALKEILKEIDRLHQVQVPMGEIDMVRNYLMGSLLSMIDGPFHVAEIIRTGIMEDLDSEYFARMISLIQSISPTEIQDLAQKYLHPDRMWQVTVGPPEN